MPSSVLGDNVISVAAAGDKVFAGTTQGLYVITDMSRPGDRGDYRVELATRRITGVLAVTPYSARGRQHVLFSSLRKVHDIDLATGAVTNIADLTFATSIAFYPPDSSYLFVGHQAGLTLLRRGADGRYSVVPMRSQVNVSVQNLFFDKSGAMFLDTDKELSTLRFPNPADPSAPLRSDYGVATGLPRDEDNMWLMLRDTARVVSDGVVYRPATGDLFAGPAPLFTPDICLNKYVEPNSDIGSIYMHKLRGSVVYTNKSVLMCDGPELVSISFRRHNSRHVGSLAIDERGRLWISRDEHLYCHDLQAVAMSHRASAPRLRLAEAHIGGSRAAVKYNGKEWDLGPIPFENNSLSLRVSLPSYRNMEAARFAFRLSRLDKEWGEWQSTGNYSISYLPAGDYVLSARAVDGIGKACPEIQIRFTVGRPWWGSLEAVILYVFAVILLTWLVVFLYNWKLYKERERLRLAVEDAVGMVQVQKEALEHQASELLRANAEMEKLSVVARYTDNAVVIMDGKGNYEWVNEGFERMYGFGLEQLTAADEGERIGRHSTQKVPEMASVWFDEKKTVVYESLSRHADGREFWTQTTLTPVLNMKGEIQNLIGIDIDINAIKEAEIEIQRQKEEASRQRDLAIAQRNEMYAQKKEMTESIRYAQNIQRILFSGKEDLERLFPYGFIINKPRDIVSGDFFLCFSVDNYRVVIVADCTGHGVPGAFMSLIGVRFFDDIVQGHGCVMPDQILNLLRDRIIVALKQTENTGDLKDGMDVAVVTVDTASGVMYYAGANNPVYVLNQGELEEILPDKMSICISEFVDKPFTLNTVPFRPGNKVYMFTDGVVDQFGGFDQKKLKSKGFKDSIKIAQSFDIENQGDMLARFIDEWRGSLDQVDDILIVGFDVDSGLDIKS